MKLCKNKQYSLTHHNTWIPWTKHFLLDIIITTISIAKYFLLLTTILPHALPMYYNHLNVCSNLIIVIQSTGRLSLINHPGMGGSWTMENDRGKVVALAVAAVIYLHMAVMQKYNYRNVHLVMYLLNYVEKMFQFHLNPLVTMRMNSFLMSLFNSKWQLLVLKKLTSWKGEECPIKFINKNHKASAHWSCLLIMSTWCIWHLSWCT